LKEHLRKKEMIGRNSLEEKKRRPSTSMASTSGDRFSKDAKIFS